MTSRSAHSVTLPIALGFLIALALAAAAPARSALIPTQIIPEACTTGSPGFPTSCRICHIAEAAINLTNFLIFAIAIPAVGLLILIAGFLLLTAGGSEDRVRQGKKIITNTIVGAFIVFLAWLGVDTIFKTLTGSEGFRGAVEYFGPWYRFPTDQCIID